MKQAPNTTSSTIPVSSRFTDDTFPNRSQLDLETFISFCRQSVDRQLYPNAETIQQCVPVYSGRLFELKAIQEIGSVERQGLLAELNRALSDGPGVVVIQGAYPDTEVVDNHSQVLQNLMEKETTTRVAGDHFAAAGANTRLWNAVEKSALSDPDSFISYYGNSALHTVSEAWLGPAYQITAQVNVVHPGGAGQQPHRDYHLGFMTDEQAERYPMSVHRLSSVMTLQGAIAHSDMPVETGPTRLLPFSQHYDLGYLAWRDPEFKAYFEANALQLPLSKGDQIWFNPALFHAAGTNCTSTVERMANLLQVSSAFGRAMETVNRPRICKHLFPVLRQQISGHQLSAEQLGRVVATAAEGYPFPTNLDTDPPVGGLAPESEQGLMLRAVQEGWTVEQFETALEKRIMARRA